MVTVVLIRQLDRLKEALANYRADIEETIKDTERLENLYEREKSKYEKRILKLQKTSAKQQRKIEYLETEINSLEMKVRCSDQQALDSELSIREGSEELQNFKTQKAWGEKPSTKLIKSLERNIKVAKEKLDLTEQNLTAIEENHENFKRAKAIELEEKLQNIRYVAAQRLKVVEARYIAKKEPLLHRIRCLENEIDGIENLIQSVPKKQLALKKKHEKLQKRLLKATMLR